MLKNNAGSLSNQSPKFSVLKVNIWLVNFIKLIFHFDLSTYVKFIFKYSRTLTQICGCSLCVNNFINFKFSERTLNFSTIFQNVCLFQISKWDQYSNNILLFLRLLVLVDAIIISNVIKTCFSTYRTCWRTLQGDPGLVVPRG